MPRMSRGSHNQHTTNMSDTPQTPKEFAQMCHDKIMDYDPPRYSDIVKVIRTVQDKLEAAELDTSRLDHVEQPRNGSPYLCHSNGNALRGAETARGVIDDSMRKAKMEAEPSSSPGTRDGKHETCDKGGYWIILPVEDADYRKCNKCGETCPF